jgi:8-oxo-dGTP pyrophosphatase MutT (NUDIX family)
MHSPIWKPHVTVAAIIERHGAFLMIEERRAGRLVLNQPAGHLDPGESILQAVVREVLEETAHPFTPTALTGIYRYLHPENRETYVRFNFTGVVTDPRPDVRLDPEIERVLWMDAAAVDAARDRHRTPIVERALADYLRGQRYDLGILADIEL